MQKLSGPIKLIEDSFKIFFHKENLLYFVSIYLLPVPFQTFSYFQGSLVDPSTGNFKYTPFIGVVVLINVLYFIVYLLTSVAGVSAVKRVVAKEPFNFKETLAFAWKNLWGFLLVSSLVFLAVLGGSILLVIPGIIFAIWFSFAKFVFVDQGLGIKASMTKSKELVKGRFWAVLGRLFVFGLFAGLIGFIASAVPFGIGSGITTLGGALFILPSFLLYKELSA